uniref:CCHC-type domain-containing protein n=1 Tax=Astyanax mexicanus TaxID=7994 RepID=A0A3B1ING5_ASTMX
MASAALRVKHWVKLKFIGHDDPPERNIVGRMILDSHWITAQDLLSFIGLPNKKEFEVCFKEQRAFSTFIDNFTNNTENWKYFEIFSPNEDEVKNIIVKFWTGRVQDEDIETYLKRYCEILKPVIKPTDNLGLWYGVRKYVVKMKKTNGQTMRIPNSVSLGPYTGKISYPGQVSACFICNSTEHQARECSETKCWQCGNLGHKSKDCSSVPLCSLCGEKGHNYFNCPNSYANRSRMPHNTQESTSRDPTVLAVQRSRTQEEAAPRPSAQDQTATRPRIQEEAAPRPRTQDQTAPRPRIQEQTVPRPRIQEQTAPRPRIQEQTASRTRTQEQMMTNKISSLKIYFISSLQKILTLLKS